MTKQILGNKLYLIGYAFPVLINALGSYGPLTGVKGGLRFLKCSKTAAGNYRMQLKNIFRIKNNVTDLTDGDFTFDLTRLKFYQNGLTYLGTAPAGALTTYSCAYYASGAATLALLSFNSSGTLTEPTTSIKVEHSVTFVKYKRGNT
jgi:hypothetical protein